MRARVCVVGALHRDAVVRAPRFPQPGETLSGHDFAWHVGGKGANQAVAASRLGARVALVGALGDDEYGGAVRGALAAEGVDLAHVRCIPGGSTGVAVITVADGGENSIVVAGGTDASLTPREVEASSSAIADADVLLVQGELAPATTRAAIDVARRSHRLVVYNASPAGPLPEGFLKGVDLLLVNRGEAAELAGDEAREVAPAGLARRLLCLGPERVVVTLGAEGALSFDGETLGHCEAFRVQTCDATGAGDAFAAALAVFRSEGVRLGESVRLACAAGALATTRAGALPSLPRREDVEALARRP